VTTTPAILDRRLYTFAQIDALAALTTGTASRWLEGYHRGDRFYPPLLREKPTGDELATWGEFVEVALVSRYRRKGLGVIRLRPMIERLSAETGVKYPLAHERPLIYDRHLILRIQKESDIPDPLRVVMQLGDGQLVLAPLAEQFFATVEWDDDIARRIMPDGRGSPVRIDPLRSFGRPTVGAVRTGRLAEAFRAGDSIEALARGYDMDPATVEAAVRFEANRALAPAA
jgi:uncharacterized protein (DUF433 family)